ncbi:hypothetical protein J2858_003110 [Neorhizobium galegae]|nr:hypothetical protein [Neorhizobium galegae]
MNKTTLNALTKVSFKAIEVLTQKVYYPCLSPQSSFYMSRSIKFS